MTPNELSSLILVVFGILTQLAFQIPSVKDWYEGTAKGLVMLGACVVIGAALFGLSCTPIGAMVGLALVCAAPSVFALLQAIAIIYVGNQGAYLALVKGR